MKLLHVVFLVVVALGIVLLLRGLTGGKQPADGPSLVFLGDGVPRGGIRQVWHLYCDRSRGNLIYMVPMVGAQYAIAVVPGGCEKGD